MGIKHRTAISMIRMQRLKAEAMSPRVSRSMRPLRSVRFSQIDPNTQEQRSGNPGLQPLEQDASLQLLQRLRQTLQPLREQQSHISREYESLQDELQRLSEHKTTQKAASSDPAWQEHTTPYTPADEESDRLPYRTIRIVASEAQAIERRDITPLDLSLYRQPLVAAPASGRSLSLVPSQEITDTRLGPLAHDEDSQLGDATANLTQESLKPGTPGRERKAINPKLALSLLDS